MNIYIYILYILYIYIIYIYIYIFYVCMHKFNVVLLVILIKHFS